jgi:Uncharacterized protein conserved in bacteria (DUF2059)
VEAGFSEVAFGWQVAKTRGVTPPFTQAFGALAWQQGGKPLVLSGQRLKGLSMNHAFLGLTIAAALAFALPMDRAQAQTTQNGVAAGEAVAADRIAALVDLMHIDKMLAVMREEGLSYGRSLDDDMLGGSAGADWTRALETIYDTETLRSRIEAAMLREYGQDGSTLADVEAFFGSDIGQNILSLEVEARRAMLDDAAKDAAELAAQQMIEDNDPRMDLLQRFAEVNDLLEMNVAGAMTSNLAFYQGLAAEGAFGNELTEEQMLSDVWNQEPQVRAESEKWLNSFMALAYQPLSDVDVKAYIAFSETPAGQRLNTVIFAAFDETFRQVSFDLGRAAARQMQGNDI